MAQEFIIMTRTYDFLAWLLPKAERFPKVYRRTMVQRLMDAALDFQEALFDAQSQGGSTRQRHLRSADAALNKVRLYLRRCRTGQDVGRATQPKPHVVVAVVRVVVVAVGRTRVVTVVVPGTAANHAGQFPR